MQLLEEGRTLEAVKITREKLGVGLKSAKEAVDHYLAQNPQIQPNSARSQASGWGWITSPRAMALIAAGSLAVLVVRLLGKG